MANYKESMGETNLMIIMMMMINLVHLKYV